MVDSLTPGWRQFGAVWLPLPHLLNVLPVQWDWAYRTGAVSVLLSAGVFAWGLAALAGLIARETGSRLAAIAMPLAILLNPNALYLQATPMTEPLMLGCALVALARVTDWQRHLDSGAAPACGLDACGPGLDALRGLGDCGGPAGTVGPGDAKRGSVAAMAHARDLSGRRRGAVPRPQLGRHRRLVRGGRLLHPRQPGVSPAPARS